MDNWLSAKNIFRSSKAIIAVHVDTFDVAIADEHDIAIVGLLDQGTVSVCQEVLRLTGHRRNVTALTWTDIDEQPTLVSAACSDYLIQWNLSECLIKQKNGDAVRGHVIRSTRADVTLICVNPTGQIVAQVCNIDNTIVITHIQNREELYTLKRHTEQVKCAQFCPHYDFTLVTGSADRVYMVWNCENGDLLYESTIVSAYPFDAICMNAYVKEFSLSASDGVVRVYGIGDEDNFCEQRHFDIYRLISRYEDSKCSADSDNQVEASPEVLAMKLFQVSTQDEDADAGLMGEETNSHESLRHLLSTIDILLAVTSSHVILVNSRTLQAISLLRFSQTSLKIGCISHAYIYPTINPDNQTVNIWICPLMSDQIRLVEVDLVEACQQSKCEDSVSVFANIPVLKNSPLRAQLVYKPPDPVKNKKKGVSKKGAVADQAVVFHNKVKSSGYSATHEKRQLFKPQIKVNSKKSGHQTKPPVAKKVYPSDSPPMSSIKSVIKVDARPTHVRTVRFSPDGQHLAVGLNNHTGLLFKMPLSENGMALAGHTGPLNSMTWSLNSKYIITSSDDCTTKVWIKGQAKHILSIDNMEGKMTDDSTAQRFPQPVTASQFYYMDKFLLASTSNSLCLCKYHIDLAHDDVKRYRNDSSYKIACKLTVDSAQSITTFSAINTFYSYVCIAGCSDRSIQVFDMNRSQQVLNIPDSHIKPPHIVHQQEGSVYSNIPTSAYDLFLSASIQDGIKLTDLRTARCVRRFDTHVNKIHPCLAEFSPCGRFITTTSEDKSVYIYEIGTGKVVSKIPGFRETTTSVSSHPFYAQTVIGTLDGRVALCTSGT